ncbi:hypothetical protein ZWY2020_004051 [Hordeum vulgare]|nr:hypothetical protein ZWY2020_004051 [Hordeum vulgare]
MTPRGRAAMPPVREWVGPTRRPWWAEWGLQLAAAVHGPSWAGTAAAPHVEPPWESAVDHHIESRASSDPNLGFRSSYFLGWRDSEVDECRSEVGVHGGSNAGLPENAVLIPALHGLIIEAAPFEVMHDDVLPPRQPLGEVSDMPIAHSPGLDGMYAQEFVAYTKLKWFCSTLMKKLAPPLLKEVQASNLRAEAEPFTPRRYTRGSKKLSEHKSSRASHAENVLMRALGLVPDDLDVDDMVVSELQNIFDSPLRDQHVRVIATLFGKEVPPMGVLEKGSASVVRAH